MLRVYLKTLLLPPAANILLILVALLLARRSPRLALATLLLSLCSLYLLSTPFIAAQLRGELETVPALRIGELLPAPAQAIVVLGADRMRMAPEYGSRDTVGTVELARVRYAARLAGITDLPLLVSGGGGFDASPVGEAELMAEVLENEFGRPVRWIESRSRNTLENADFSGDILLAEGVRQILLVTSAWHMPRAAALFRARGFQVVPAPTGFYSRDYVDPVYEWLPNAGALQASSWSLHEFLGLAWYRLQGRI